ncbi:MAG: acyltransferase [Janthinobacterium lividum]
MSAQGVYLTSTVLGDDVLGRRARVWLLRAAGADLARGAMLHGGTFITRPGRLVVGKGSFVSRSCYLDLEADLVLGDHVTVGHGTSFVTTRHRLGPPELRCGTFSGEAITVGDGAWLGANVTVLPGVTIGNGAVVAAGAVVVADVPSNVLVAGVPARVLRALNPDGS